MSDYTPTTETVLDCFITGAEGNFIAADFYDWLSAHDAEVVAEERAAARNGRQMLANRIVALEETLASGFDSILTAPLRNDLADVLIALDPVDALDCLAATRAIGERLRRGTDD